MLLEEQAVTVVVSAPSDCGKTMLVTKLCHDADVIGTHIVFVFYWHYYIGINKFSHVVFKFGRKV